MTGFVAAMAGATVGSIPVLYNQDWWLYVGNPWADMSVADPPNLVQFSAAFLAFSLAAWFALAIGYGPAHWIVGEKVAPVMDEIVADRRRTTATRT